jgi:hypothetical protein
MNRADAGVKIRLTPDMPMTVLAMD